MLTHIVTNQGKSLQRGNPAGESTVSGKALAAGSSILQTHPKLVGICERVANKIKSYAITHFNEPAASALPLTVRDERVECRRS